MRLTIRRICLSAVVLVVLSSSASAGDGPPPPLRVIDAQPDERMNALFRSTDGWIGADGVYSVPLPDDSTLWIFGDTLVGQVRDGRRHDLSMVNNSFARQRGWGADARVDLLINRDDAGKATSYVVPQNKSGYFWIWDGIVLDGKLYAFTTRLTSPGTITAFDWKLMDQSLIVVENPLDDPATWRVCQYDLPFGAFTEEYEALWGLEVLLADGHMYVYGTTRQRSGDPRALVVARVLPGDLTTFDRWRFFRDGAWQPDARQGSALTTGVGTEGSVTWVPERQRYMYVYSPPLDPRILMRTAETPVGPWSEAVVVYTCPEVQWDPRIFCYAGKARLVPGTSDQLLISYATNSFDMLPHVTADARVYTPRFVRGTLAD